MSLNLIDQAAQRKRIEEILSNPVESAKVIADLRQQLSTLKAELKCIGEAIDDPRTDLTMTMSELILEYKQQLAGANARIELMGETALNQQKREVMLRETLQNIVKTEAGDGWYGSPTWQACKALAATADLDGLILCEKKPIAYMIKCNDQVMGFVPTQEKGTIPVFRAWEPK